MHKTFVNLTYKICYRMIPDICMCECVCIFIEKPHFCSVKFSVSLDSIQTQKCRIKYINSMNLIKFTFKMFFFNEYKYKSVSKVYYVCLKFIYFNSDWNKKSLRYIL